MPGAGIAKARSPGIECPAARWSVQADTPGGFYANQFENTANFRAHYTTTGPEIWEQTNGSLDGFVMAVIARLGRTPAVCGALSAMR